MTAAELRRILIPATLPESEEYRRYYGRALNPGTIESALRQAEAGMFLDLTDLENESLSLEPHATAALVKRFASIASLDWDMVPAEGKDVDGKLAEELVDATRRNLEGIPSFATALYELAWARFYNRGAQEIHWRGPSSGDVRWSTESLAWINPRRLAFGPERELLLIDTWRQSSSFVEQGFALRDAPAKFLTWVPRTFSVYPEQDGVGPRILYWAFFKRFTWRMRMQLTELFALPWRIITVDAEQGIDWEKLQEAADLVQRLGRTNTAQLPPGANLEVVFPGENSGNLFQMTNDDVDKQMSKLILGNTGTTEGTESNRANAIIQKGEQDIILSMDAAEISDRVQSCIVEPFVWLTWGDAGLAACPKFRLRAEPPRDVEKEIKNASGLIELGLPVAEQQLRERTGWRRPDPEEAFVIKSGGGGKDAMGNALPPETKLVDPKAEPGEPGDPTGATADPDALAAGAGSLEEGGEDEAAANAVADLLEATGIQMSTGARAGLAALKGKAGAFALELLVQQGTKAERLELVGTTVRRLGRARLARAAEALSITGNHGHTLPALDDALLAVAAAQGDGSATMSIQGDGGHDHTILLDPEALTAIRTGQVVTVTSSTGGDNGHTHTLQLGYPVEEDELAELEAVVGAPLLELADRLVARGLVEDQARQVAGAQFLRLEAVRDHHVR